MFNYGSYNLVRRTYKFCQACCKLCFALYFHLGGQIYVVLYNQETIQKQTSKFSVGSPVSLVNSL